MNDKVRGATVKMSDNVRRATVAHSIFIAMRTRVSMHMRTAKAQISLRLVDSEFSRSVIRIGGYCRIYERRAKAWMILFPCAGWSESARFALVRRHVFSQRSLYHVTMNKEVLYSRSFLYRHSIQRQNSL